MTIYLDIIFLENLFMNYIILYATSTILKEKTRPLAMLFSSCIGSIYAVLLYTTYVEIFSNIILKIFLSIFMVYVAYKPKTVKKLLKNVLIFYFTSFMFGGVTLALLHTVNKNNIIFNNGVLKNINLIKTIFIGGFIGFFIITIGIKAIKERLNKQDLFCTIQIIINSKKLVIKAMLDTGNLLKEPITKAPVIIVEKVKLKEIISEEIIENMLQIIECKDIELGEYKSKIKIIPFSSVGAKNSLLVGIKANSVIVDYNNKYIYTDKAIIGIYDGVFKKGYSGLIGLEIITNEGGTNNENFRNDKIKC